MNVLTSLTKKNLILNKKRTIVTIIGIILSCALICSVANLIVSFQQFLINVTIENRGGHHAIFEQVSIEDAKNISNNKKIKDTLLLNELGSVLIDEPKSENKPFIAIKALNKDYLEFKGIKLKEGRLPEKSNEIIIQETLITEENKNYKIGEKLNFTIGKRISNDKIISSDNYYPSYDLEGNQETYIIDKTVTYEIVGIFSTERTNSYSASSYIAYTYLDYDLVKTLDNVDVFVTCKNIRKCYEDVNEIKETLEIEKADFNDDLLRFYGVTGRDSTNKVLYTIGLILIIVIMIASIIVIYNSFIISITERKKQFGMLSSIGATSRQLRSMVIKEGIFLSIIGIPLGILLSIVGIGITLMVVNNLGIFSDYFASELKLVISLPALVIAALISALTVFLSSLVPSIKVSRTSPIDAIRLSSDIKIKGKKVKTSKLTRKIFGIEGDLGLKNMKRNKKKYRSTIISLFVSIVLFMTISAFATYTFKSALKIYTNYNYNILIYSSSTTDNIDEIYKKIKNSTNVEDYSLVKMISLNTLVDKKDINNEIVDKLDCSKDTNKCEITINLATLGEESFTKFIKKNNLKESDYLDTSNIKVIFTKENTYIDYANSQMFELELLKYKKGDSFDTYYLNSENKKITSQKITIGSYTDIYPIGFTDEAIPIGTIQGFISDKAYDTFSDELKSDRYLFVKSSDANKLYKEITKFNTDNNLKLSIVNINDMAKELKNIILAIDIFLYGFIVLVSLITVTNIINTVTTSIYLRRREFAMIKAVGMTNKSFNKMIAYESIFYGIKGALYGVIVGTTLDYLLYKSINEVYIYDYQLPYKTILISIFFVLIIISITMAYSVRKIRNDNIVDVIKQENL